MTRGQGFAIADMNTSYFDDPKVKKLVHDLGDPAKVAMCLTLHQATVLESWRSGSRATAPESAPVWMPGVPALVGHLQEAEMLSKDGRLPLSSWRHWFAPAQERREKRVAAGREGGKKSAQSRSAKLKQRLTDAEPVQPSVRPSESLSSATPQSETARDLWSLCLLAEELIGRWSAHQGHWAFETLSKDFQALGFDAVAEAMRAARGAERDKAFEESTFMSAVHKRLYPFDAAKPSANGVTKRAEHSLSTEELDRAFQR